jgi:hypothetical protein
MSRVTIEQLQNVLNNYGGQLAKGSHANTQNACCALELLSLVRGHEYTDNPQTLRIFDLRNLNDIDVSDELRTKYMLPVVAAYAGSLDWPIERQKHVVHRIVILTVQRIISQLPGLSEEIKKQCETATTLELAYAAANTIRYAADAAADAADAARAAADAAANAARAAAAYSAREKMFIIACELWIEAIK